tara:strand:- start:5018 stop:7390 length:2373 start_codon:yes stop_codon:yes gene_type:complete
MKVTIFKSVKDTSVPFYRDVDFILSRIKEGKSKELIEKIRKEKDKELRNKIKQQLPAICFSGEFSDRKDKSILKHSGIICLDFDGFKTKKELLNKKQEIKNDVHTHSVFISPSGNGLKVLVKVPSDIDNHVKYFMSLQDYYNCSEFDTTCKNISRVCYESYDKDIFINKNSSVYESKEVLNHEQHEYKNHSPTLVLTKQDAIVDRLKKWWENKYGMIDGQRNNNIYILASSLNDFGIDKGLASYVMSEYVSDGFTFNEMSATINSAYQNASNYNTRFFEDSEAIDQIKNKLKIGVPKKEIRNILKTKGYDPDTIDTVIKEEERSDKGSEFWIKSEKGVVSIIPFKFKEFLEKHGFYKYTPEGSTNYIFIVIKSNIIDNTTDDLIKDYVLKYLIELEDLSIYNHFAERTKYFKEDFLSLLSYKKIYFIENSEFESYLYFKNLALRVTKEKLEKINYDSLDGFVWKEQVINREFEYCDDNNCDYSQFITNISNKNETRVKSVESTIGFLLQGHKNAGYCPAIIIHDENDSEEPEGGTGKGLFVQGISQLKKNVTIDGKSFFFERSFAYQLVSVDTQILTFDDVKKGFEFERLFSIITEGITLEKKNKDAIKIPFEKSPKVVITTNYAIRGTGNSFERRKWELEFYAHYSKAFTPHDEFGKLFFSQWDLDEWCSFDNYMIKCLQLYLREGLVSAPFKNLKNRKFEASTSREFVTFIQENMVFFPFDVSINSNSVRIEFILQNPDYSKLSHSKWNKWMRVACKHLTGFEAEQGRNAAGVYFLFKEPISQTSIWK